MGGRPASLAGELEMVGGQGRDASGELERTASTTAGSHPPPSQPSDAIATSPAWLCLSRVLRFCDVLWLGREILIWTDVGGSIDPPSRASEADLNAHVPLTRRLPSTTPIHSHSIGTASQASRCHPSQTSPAPGPRRALPLNAVCVWPQTSTRRQRPPTSRRPCRRRRASPPRPPPPTQTSPCVRAS